MSTKKPEGRPVKYGPTEIAFILENLGKKTTAEMAKHFSIENGAFRKILSGLRLKGYNIPVGTPGNPHKTGDIVHRKGKNRIRTYIKLGNGKWKEVLKGTGRGRRKTTGTGIKNTRKPNAKPRRHTSKLFVSPAIIEQINEKQQVIEKIKIILPGGLFVLCDKDKVDATVRFLSKKTG